MLIDPDIKDLHSLLRPKFGNEFIIENCEIKDFLLPGENYGSKIVSVHVIIRRTKLSNNEDIWLIAKLPPTLQIQREIFNSPFTFSKEYFMYKKILPHYKQLNISNGKNNLYDIGADFYGARLSLNSDVEFDDNAAILLENLKIKNYYSVDRKLGCDLLHAKLAIKKLAEFHAFGLATKEKHSDLFNLFKKKSKCMEFKDIDGWTKVVTKKLKFIENDKVMSVHFEDCKKAVESAGFNVWTDVPEEPWSTIIHADFWTNNIMFHKGDNGELDDVKFVDFQNYLFLAPTRDLTFFIGCGLDGNVIKENVDELIDLYYETIIEKIKQLDCDIEPYSRASFDKRIKIDACIEFTHCMCMLKIITLDTDSDNLDASDVINVMEDEGVNHFYLERVRNFVSVFHARGWLGNNL
ncbi:uncharacterized protein LOC122858134 [Aphidius gifuensis]|uniref:uncharacterized protein LOC122858134 n=1 Tax=Aphidius gifuensis TaxID=684658 RepID=UPI001CDBFB50|nr:uncharacterized protein LOC122858134 [Aphidius gifuensis]